MKLYALILAGGSGTRFWPLSRKTRPKQFLPIVSDKTMIEETVARLKPLVPKKNIFTVANLGQTRVIKSLLHGVPAKNFIVEPLARNTAPSLILATARIYLEDPEAVIAALPADHLIQNKPRFLEKLETGAAAAAENEVLVTFGIPPTFPSTGYGYLHFAEKTARKAGKGMFYRVLKFKEKPELEQARKFIMTGDHWWNSGMFLWRASVFARQLERFAPNFFPFWKRILASLEAGNKAGLLSIFKNIPAVSIDYALMEKSKSVVVTEGDFGWSDVGAWSSLVDIWPRDESGNAVRGECLALDSKNCLVYNPGKLTAIIGLENVMVVETDDALLVCHKDRDQNVKTVIEALGRQGKKKYQ